MLNKLFKLFQAGKQPKYRYFKLTSTISCDKVADNVDQGQTVLSVQSDLNLQCLHKRFNSVPAL